ncbi:rho GTPase-activating protein 19-like isoform X2 [Daphnia pulex]|uniref:rho GTPase-activating protein 19-like isoform X2 n=1 Tax=Daphnia pulex TaxID=6669 RepID=UPI001EE147FA|nr:rho GTPase-activating protein 19-like isoform X2 [Daphnia pulex]
MFEFHPSSRKMDSDEAVVKKLRNDFPDQFTSLVKMHLSFCLDQSTDEVDCLTPSKTSDKKSVTSNKKTRIPKQTCNSEGIKYASQINQLIDYLSKPSSLVQEGLFRRNGKVKQQQELMNLVKEKQVSEITALLESNEYSVHEVATVLKNLLAEMPEPLLIESYYPLHCCLAKLNHQERQIKGCQLLVLLLPNENAEILRRLLNMLHEVSLHKETNKMNAMNLGIVLAPHILCPRKMSAEDLTTNASSLAHIVSFMIETTKVLFDLPPEFVSDVRLHFKRDNEEDSSSTSSTPPVKTTITFVDREMTAKVVAEVGLDPTEAALAELYAYVQSQPESEVKKKWVHKFNKENGCGTPKVILNSSISDACAKNCKNLSQSIRKHLFNGTGVTPKRRRSKSSSRAHALCYSGETSPPLPDSLVSSDECKSPSIKSGRLHHVSSRRSLLESTPTSSDYIRHPAFTKPPRNVASNPLSAVHSDLTKESNIHQDQVISPLTQSAQRFPFYVRDSIMTPRCRKPVFTFSPIDEPADDLVPNSDSLQLANMNNLIHPPPSVHETNKASEEPSCSSSSSSSSDKDNSDVEEDSDISLTVDSESSILSGCALIQESTGPLTSPFKKYLMNREIQVFDESGQEQELQEEISTTEPSLSSSNQAISESLLEFLDGNGQETDSYPHSSPSRPSPPLTKNTPEY